MPRSRNLAVAAFASAALSACGGGGGGSNIREVPFSSFAAVQPNERVVMQGTSQTASGSITSSPGGGFNVDTANLNPAVQDGTLKLTYDAAGSISSIDFSTPSASASFVGASCASGVCSAETASSVAIVIDARAAVVGWNYQTFGVWLNQTGPATFQAGGISAGAVTPATAVPTSGPGNFIGKAAGFYVNPFGAAFATAADMTAVVDFGARTIVFATTNTNAANLSTGTNAANLSTGAPLLNSTNLNLQGTLSYVAGSNQFSGNVNAPAASLTGSATGRFYGPAAEEIGGTYGLNGSGPTERLMGAFGGKR
jgi:C-lobe and N-lobe beta barrels of Tf-binding protein B